MLSTIQQELSWPRRMVVPADRPGTIGVPLLSEERLDALSRDDPLLRAERGLAEQQPAVEAFQAAEGLLQDGNEDGTDRRFAASFDINLGILPDFDLNKTLGEFDFGKSLGELTESMIDWQNSVSLGFDGSADETKNETRRSWSLPSFSLPFWGGGGDKSNATADTGSNATATATAQRLSRWKKQKPTPATPKQPKPTRQVQVALNTTLASVDATSNVEANASSQSDDRWWTVPLGVAGAPVRLAGSVVTTLAGGGGSDEANETVVSEAMSDAALRRAFDAFDTDGSGTIDRAEMGAMVVQLGLPLSAARIDQLMVGVVKDDADSDARGEIDFDEFVSTLRTQLAEDDAESFTGSLVQVVGEASALLGGFVNRGFELNPTGMLAAAREAAQANRQQAAAKAKASRPKSTASAALATVLNAKSAKTARNPKSPKGARSRGVVPAREAAAREAAAREAASEAAAAAAATATAVAAPTEEEDGEEEAAEAATAKEHEEHEDEAMVATAEVVPAKARAE